MDKWNRYTLFLLLLISGCLMTGAGYVGADGIYSSYSRKEGWMTPGLSLVFQGMKDGIYPWMLFVPQAGETVALLPEGEDGTEEAPGGAAVDTDGGVMTDGSEESRAEDLAAEEGSREEGSVSRNAPVILAPAGETGPKYDRFGNLLAEGEGTQQRKDPAPEGDGTEAAQGDADGKEGQEVQEPSAPPADMEPAVAEGHTEALPESTAPEPVASVPPMGGSYGFVPVSEDYFKDALFIGDSRTVGLCEYGGFPQETTFYAVTSMTIYNVFRTPKKIVRMDDGRKVTIEEALTEREFGKIYLMLGINEIGRGSTESFFTAYAEAVNKIRLLQPNAIIFVQGIMRVGAQKSSTDAVFNNGKINERNQALAAMNNGQDIFYLEVNDVLCDENGDLVSEYTFDQIHLKAKYYRLWKDYLFLHGIVRA